MVVILTAGHQWECYVVRVNDGTTHTDKIQIGSRVVMAFSDLLYRIARMPHCEPRRHEIERDMRCDSAPL
jgi:hypothetical protein